MRKLFLGAAAAMALAAPGVAAANGYVGLDYTNVDVDGAGSEDAVGLSGSVVLTPHIALDAAVSDADDDTVWGATGHLFTNNRQYLFGGFLGVVGDDDTSTWGAGFEGQYYISNITLAGAVGYANNDDADVDGWGANGEARYFFNDNFRVEGGVGWTRVDFGGGFDDNAVTLGLGGEYQLATMPLSFGLGYSHTSFDDLDIDADTVSAMARWNFGGGSLFDRDHSGGGLAGLSGVAAAIGL